MFKTYLNNMKKNVARFRLESLLLSSSMKSDAGETFFTTRSLDDAKYSLTSGTLYDVIGVINPNKIKNWNEIKKSSRWKKNVKNKKMKKKIMKIMKTNKCEVPVSN